jgi:transmembrane secretion effector
LAALTLAGHRLYCVPPGERHFASKTRLLETADNVTIAAAPALGGVLVAVIGPAPAYVLNALTFVGSAFLLARINRSLEDERKEIAGCYWADAADALRLLGASRALFAVCVSWSIAVLGMSAVNVSEIVLVTDVFHGGSLEFGMLGSALGLGLGAGSLSAARAVAGLGIRSAYGGSLVLMAVAIVAAAGSPTVWAVERGGAPAARVEPAGQPA